MKFNVDSHFVIGRDHVRQNAPCQDHALTALGNESSFIIISDGCSSGRHTDIGARIITTSGIMSFREYENSKRHVSPHMLAKKFQNEIKSRSEKIRIALGLIPADLYATCIYAFVSKEGGFVHVIGDGNAILSYEDGRRITYSLKWNENTPYYLSYSHSSLHDFIEIHTKIEGGEKSLKITKKIATAGEKITEETFLSVEAGLSGYTIEINPKDSMIGLTSIIIASDGAESFTGDDKEDNSERVTKELSSFKLFEGEFVKRRLARMLLTLSKEGIEPTDDISCAAIHVDHNNYIQCN